MPAADVIVDASKVRYGRDEAIELARTMKRVISGRGKKLVTLDLEQESPDDDTLAAILLGPTGNLKAPTLKVGSTLLVGFCEPAYLEIFAGDQKS